MHIGFTAPKDKELDSITDIIKNQIERSKDVIVNVNNHYEGCAVMTIERLMERLLINAPLQT
jgi:uncharacterized protein YecE (DUF72 family)